MKAFLIIVRGRGENEKDKNMNYKFATILGVPKKYLVIRIIKVRTSM